VTQSEYQRRLAQLRQSPIFTQQSIKVYLERSLNKAMGDLNDLIGAAAITGKAPITQSLYASKRAGIERWANELGITVGRDIRSGMAAVAQDVANAKTQLYDQYARADGQQINWDSLMGTVPGDVVSVAANRLWPDGKILSDRIWNLGIHAREGVNGIITGGIARGQSAVSMSKELRRFLVNPDLTPGTTWTTKVKPSVTGRGTIHYNALRLARTEINNAYREAQVQTAMRSPLVSGLKWNLSASHPILDICDAWAEVDAYGLGSGVYPPEAMPIDHPQGLCFFTEVLRKPKDWKKPKPRPSRMRLSKEQVLRPLISKGATDGQLNTAWNMWNNTNDLVAKGIPVIDQILKKTPSPVIKPKPKPKAKPPASKPEDPEAFVPAKTLKEARAFAHKLVELGQQDYDKMYGKNASWWKAAGGNPEKVLPFVGKISMPKTMDLEAMNIVNKRFAEVQARCVKIGIPRMRGLRMIKSNRINGEMRDGIMFLEYRQVTSWKKTIDDYIKEQNAGIAKAKENLAFWSDPKRLTGTTTKETIAKYTGWYQDEIVRRQKIIDRHKAGEHPSTEVSSWTRAGAVNGTNPARPFSSSSYIPAGPAKIHRLIEHEFGHHINDTYGLGTRALYETKEKLPSFTKGYSHFNKTEKFIREQHRISKGGAIAPSQVKKQYLAATKYADTNAHEWFAEIHALYVAGRRDLIEPEGLKLLDDLYKGVTLP